MTTEARDHPVDHAVDDVLAHEAAGEERVEHAGEVDIVERQDVELQLVRPPLEAALAVGRAPQPGVGDAQWQAALAFGCPQIVMAEELGLDGADAGHVGIVGPNRPIAYFCTNCRAPVPSAAAPTW